MRTVSQIKIQILMLTFCVSVIMPYIAPKKLPPANIFGTLKGLSPYFWSQKTRTLSLTRDPPESQFLSVNIDSVDYITVGIS